MADTKARSATKGITWRILATLTTMLWVFLISGSLTITFGIGVIDLIVKFLLYYAHERAWALISWGVHS